METFSLLIANLLTCLHHCIDVYKMLTNHFVVLYELSSLDISASVFLNLHFTPKTWIMKTFLMNLNHSNSLYS